MGSEMCIRDRAAFFTNSSDRSDCGSVDLSTIASFGGFVSAFIGNGGLFDRSPVIGPRDSLWYTGLDLKSVDFETNSEGH